MKKVVLVPALLGVMGIGGFIAVVGGDLIGSADSTEKLTVEQIEKQALQEVNGRITELEFEKEGTRSVYEVEVTTKDAEYDLKFDALTGALLKKDKNSLELDDRRDDDFDVNPKGLDDNPTSQNNVVKSVKVDDQDDKQVQQPVKTQPSIATQTTETQKSTNPTPTKVVVTNDDDDRYDDDRYDDDRYDDDDDDDNDNDNDDDDDDDDN